MFAESEYSITSYIKLLGDFVDLSSKPSFRELSKFIKDACPKIDRQIFENAEWSKHLSSILSPGDVHEYSFPVELIDESPILSEYISEVHFSVWFLTDTNTIIPELAFTSKPVSSEVEDASNVRKAIDKLRQDTLAMLRRNRVLHINQSSKTELYFDAYFNKNNNRDIDKTNK